MMGKPVFWAFLVALVALVPATGWAGSASTNLAPGGGPVALDQSIGDGSVGFFVDDQQVSTNPIPSGGAIIGVLLHESCFSGNQYCTSPGDLDHITIGNQTAIILGSINDPRCQSSSDCGGFALGSNGSGGLTLTVWWLPNVQGNPTIIDFVPSSGGQMWYGGMVASVFSGVPANASIDAVAGLGYAPTGAWNGDCCADGYLRSGPVTPSQSGDLLYGAGSQYGTGPTAPGPGGWIASNVGPIGYFGKADEYLVYNSTAPVSAPLPASSGSVSWVMTVAVKLQ